MQQAPESGTDGAGHRHDHVRRPHEAVRSGRERGAQILRQKGLQDHDPAQRAPVQAPSHRKPAIAYGKESKGARAYLSGGWLIKREEKAAKAAQEAAAASCWRWNAGKAEEGSRHGPRRALREYPAPQAGRREETAPDLPIEKIEPRADQPRKRFDPEALEMLAESTFRTLWAHQPITVRPLDGGFYQIIAGERPLARQPHGRAQSTGAHPDSGRAASWRWRWSRNLQREDLNPIEEAGYRALQDVYGMTQDDGAERGQVTSAVTNATRLLALSEPVLVEDGTLSAGHARALLPLSDPEMQLAAAKTVIERCT